MIGVETCDRCGFVRSEWTEQDATRTLHHADGLLQGWSADAPPELEPQLEARRIDDLRAIDTSPDIYDDVHWLWHGLVSIADVRRAAGDSVQRQEGAVAQLNASDGGVPKTAVESADVALRGVAGDRQGSRAHHGRPWQALCLWSAEVIDSFAADGHPIAPGSAGENITISGIDWSNLRGGTIVDIGSVRCQLSAPAEPCRNNAQWFTDGDITRIDPSIHPETSRWYASVIRAGSIRPGDAVVVSPI